MQLGRTKVFLRAGQIAALDLRRNEVLDNAARFIQGRFRTFIAHKEFVMTRNAAISLQAYCRGLTFHISISSFCLASCQFIEILYYA